MKDFQSELTRRNRENAEDRILAEMKIRCKVCQALMRRYRQDGKVYYFCGNCNRSVWIDMPEYL